jgi:UvrB/uvrC motif
MFKKGELNEEEFLLLIKELNLTCDFSVIDLESKKLIKEDWYSETNPFVRLTRMYPFIDENIQKIPVKQRIKFLKNLLNEAVEVENYEEAARLRDIINSENL